MEPQLSQDPQNEDRLPKIHPNLISNHEKLKAWNEYIIEHLGLRIDKQSRKDYRAIYVYQGTFCLYHNWAVTIKTTTNAEMHYYLHRFLSDYLNHFLSFKGMAENPDFRPPVIQKIDASTKLYPFNHEGRNNEEYPDR